MAAKSCIIIHGCSSTPVDESYKNILNWRNWAKRQLIAKGIETETPLMPEPWKPDYEKFKQRWYLIFAKCLQKL